MKKETLKEILLDAIIEQGFASCTHANAMTQQGLAEFTGNQHSEGWAWKRSELEKKTIEELASLYAGFER